MVNSTIKQLLDQGVIALKNKNIENPLLEAQLILAHNMNVDRLFILTNLEKTVEDNVIKSYIRDIERKSNGMPTQYIIGMQEFMGLDFEVTEDVLIPRPDTEILVGQVLESIEVNKNYNILDIGTGSGCIAVSIAKYAKNVIIHAVDISEKALKIAKYNAIKNNVEERIKFYQGDIFSPFIDNNIKFDRIISNPPYIERDEIQKLDVNVKDYEPSLALDGGEDGLEFYRRIISNAKSYMNDNGLIFFEIGYNQANSVEELLKNNLFADIIVTKDLAGLDRVIKSKFIL